MLGLLVSVRSPSIFVVGVFAWRSRVKANLRDQARQAVSRAKSELATGDDVRLRYAALELRLAMEALTYDRADAYKAEIPPKEWETWQPRKVLQLLLDIDPNADKECMLSIGVEEEFGKEASNMSVLGAESILNLSILKKHYDALGAHLHMPTLKQIAESAQFDVGRLRKRCTEIVGSLDKVLVSSVFNVTLGMFSTISCMRCEAKIRKRTPHDKSVLEVCCFACGAEYRLHDVGDGQVEWKPIREEIKCPTSGCNTAVWLWRDEAKPRTWWTCEGCGEAFEIALGLVRKGVDSTDPAKE